MEPRLTSEPRYAPTAAVSRGVLPAGLTGALKEAAAQPWPPRSEPTPESPTHHAHGDA